MVYILIPNDNYYYIGSAINLSQRFRQHRYKATLIKNKFYNYINKYGWENFKYGILEHINMKNIHDLVNKKKYILKKEQFYLDKYKPFLNTNLIANSMLGFKHTEDTKLKLSIMKRGKKLVMTNLAVPLKTKIIIQEVIHKLKLRSKGVKIKIYNKNNVYVKEFNTIKEAALYVGLSPSSVSRYLKKESLLANTFYFKFSIQQKQYEHKQPSINQKINNITKKGKGLLVLDKNNKTVMKFSSITSASRYLDISRESLRKYHIYNKLWNDKYFFKIV